MAPKGRALPAAVRQTVSHEADMEAIRRAEVARRGPAAGAAPLGAANRGGAAAGGPAATGPSQAAAAGGGVVPLTLAERMKAAGTAAGAAARAARAAAAPKGTWLDALKERRLARAAAAGGGQGGGRSKTFPVLYKFHEVGLRLKAGGLGLWRGRRPGKRSGARGGCRGGSRPRLPCRRHALPANAQLIPRHRPRCARAGLHQRCEAPGADAGAALMTRWTGAAPGSAAADPCSALQRRPPLIALMLRPAYSVYASSGLAGWVGKGRELIVKQGSRSEGKASTPTGACIRALGDLAGSSALGRPHTPKPYNLRP